MRIYLLILLLAVLAHTKFRHLRNLTITIPGEITLKGLSSSEIAYQYQDTITIFDINRKQALQTIKQPAASPMQFVPSTNALIYPNGNNINQVRSNANQRTLNIPLSDQTWMADIGAAAGDVVTATYGPTGKDRILEIYGIGANPSDYKRLTWAGFPKEDTNVGSGVSVVSADEFYFAVGGVCTQQNEGLVYLQHGSRAGIKNVANFSFGDCRLFSNDYEWTLQSYKINNVRYHLLTYQFFSDVNKLSVSQLISNQSGKYEELAHFQIDRQIGAEMTSIDEIYTADNILCRVLRHDIQNHDHGHNPTAFKDLPYWTFVTPSEKYVAVMSVSDTTYQTRAQILNVIDKDIKLKFYYTFPLFADRVEISNDQYVLATTMTKDSKAFLTMSDLNGNTTLKAVKDNVFDFCVSDQNVVFISDLPTETEQTITAYKIVDGQLQASSTPITVAKNASLSLKCLNDNHLLLAPVAGGPNTIYVYGYDNIDTLTLRSQNKSDSTTRIQFQAVNNIIITSPPEKNSYKFYDYDLKQLPLSFNLPPNSVYKIVQATNGGLLLAVGDDIKHFVSLQYYTVDQLTITYKGTYPYFDSGQSDHPASVLLTKTGSLHIQYSGWSTYYDLNAPPMTSFGYFYSTDNQCSGFQDAIFQPTTGGQPNMIVLNKDTPAIQVYSITDKLQKKSTFPISFKSSYLSLKKSSNPNEIIISGINDKSNYRIEVRNINALSQPIFTNEKAFTAREKKIESTQVVQQFVVSAFSDQSNLTLFFDANSDTPIPVQNAKFKTITLLATCPACSKIAFTGDLVTPVAGTTIVVQDYEDVTNFNSVDTTCKINLLAVSPSGQKLAYNCDTNKLIVNAGTEVALTQTFTTISDLAFLDENSLIANLDGTVTPILITPGKLLALKRGRTAGSNLYAVDYSKQIYALTNGPTTVDFFNVAGLLIQSVTLDSIDQISSMSFNSDSELVVITVTGTIVVLTADACNINQQLVNNYYCVCKSLFTQDADQCNCAYKYDSSAGNCNCNDGYFYVGDNSCDECSAMCNTCSSGGAFSCDEFGVWFYLIIIGSILIIAGGVLFAVFRIKKKQKQDSMYTEEKTKMTEPFVSEKEDKSEKGSKNKFEI